MFLYFISALIIGTVLFKLGSYWSIIHIMLMSGKAVVALLLVAGLVLVFRKFMYSRSRNRQRTLPHTHS